MTAVVSYDPRFCPACAGAGQMAARLIGDHPLALIRTLPCPAHVDARPLQRWIGAPRPSPRSPQGDAA